MNKKELSTRYPGDWNEPTPIKVVEDPVWGVKCNVIAQYGDWAVTDDGDVIQTDEWYPIWSDTFLDCDNDDWILHLSEFDWFTTQSYEDFKRALWLACKIIGIPYPKQKREY